MPRAIGERDSVTGRIVGRTGKPQNGNGSDAGESDIDPVEAGTSPGAEPSEPGTGPRRRGGTGGGTGTGKRAGTAKAPKAGASLDLTGLTAIWAGVHLQLARLADCPAIAMTEGEAKGFLIAWQNYLRHYSIAATQRTVDLVTACGVTLFLYVPRGMALAERRRHGIGGNKPPREAREPSGPIPLFRFNPPPNGAQPPPGAASEPETYEPEMPATEGVH
jgi:hypothetical protein